MIWNPRGSPLPLLKHFSRDQLFKPFPLYECVGSWGDGYTHVFLCVQKQRPEEVSPSVTPYLISLRRALSLNLKIVVLASLVDQQDLRIFLSLPHHVGLQAYQSMPSSYMSAENLNSGPCACVQQALLATKPSSQLPCMPFTV